MVRVYLPRVSNKSTICSLSTLMQLLLTRSGGHWGTSIFNQHINITSTTVQKENKECNDKGTWNADDLNAAWHWQQYHEGNWHGRPGSCQKLAEWPSWCDGCRPFVPPPARHGPMWPWCPRTKSRSFSGTMSFSRRSNANPLWNLYLVSLSHYTDYTGQPQPLGGVGSSHESCIQSEQRLCRATVARWEEPACSLGLWRNQGWNPAIRGTCPAGQKYLHSKTRCKSPDFCMWSWKIFCIAFAQAGNSWPWPSPILHWTPAVHGSIWKMYFIFQIRWQSFGTMRNVSMTRVTSPDCLPSACSAQPGKYCSNCARELPASGKFSNNHQKQ